MIVLAIGPLMESHYMLTPSVRLRVCMSLCRVSVQNSMTDSHRKIKYFEMFVVALIIVDA